MHRGRLVFAGEAWWGVAEIPLGSQSRCFGGERASSRSRCSIQIQWPGEERDKQYGEAPEAQQRGEATYKHENRAELGDILSVLLYD